jgi:hypothetical protein
MGRIDNTAAAFARLGARLDPRGFDRYDKSFRSERCYVCQKGQPGLSELPDGRFVHRWPCRDRVR